MLITARWVYIQLNRPRFQILNEDSSDCLFLILSYQKKSSWTYHVLLIRYLFHFFKQNFTLSEPIEVSVDRLQGSWTSDHCSDTTGSFLVQIGYDQESVQQILGLGYETNFGVFIRLHFRILDDWDVKLDIIISFEFDQQVGSLTKIKVRDAQFRPYERERYERYGGKVIILHNKKWTENRTMRRSYLLNFTGKAQIFVPSSVYQKPKATMSFFYDMRLILITLQTLLPHSTLLTKENSR